VGAGHVGDQTQGLSTRERKAMTQNPEQTRETVTGDVVNFTLDMPEVTFPRLRNLMDDLFGVLREVQSDFLSGQVRWRIERLSLASPLVVASRPVSEDKDLTQSNLRSLSGFVTNGLKQIQREAVRPPHFTDQALEKTRDIIEMIRKTEGTLAVDSTRLDEHVVTNVNEVLGAVVTGIGSVEGRLEAFNVHGNNRYFNVYDSLTGARVRCDFGHRIPAYEVGAAAERRVVVHGEIRYREDGQIVNVVAHTLEVLPDEGDLPSANDVLGILA